MRQADLTDLRNSGAVVIGSCHKILRKMCWDMGAEEWGWRRWFRVEGREACECCVERCPIHMCVYVCVGGLTGPSEAKRLPLSVPSRVPERPGPPGSKQKWTQYPLDSWY